MYNNYSNETVTVEVPKRTPGGMVIDGREIISSAIYSDGSSREITRDGRIYEAKYGEHPKFVRQMDKDEFKSCLLEEDRYFGIINENNK